MILKKCNQCNTYTLKTKCPKCNKPTKDAHYKFSKIKDAPKSNPKIVRRN
jgi:rRNA maturation protein Nop10